MASLAWIGLGSNADARWHLARARGALGAELPVLRVTVPRESPPEGGGTGLYWNQILLAQSTFSVEELTAVCKRIERDIAPWPRSAGCVLIDLDLLRTVDFEAEDLWLRRYWRPHLEELGAR